MALSMLDKKAAHEDRSEWPSNIRAEFDEESSNPNGCVGTELLSETDKVRVWIIRLAPGERVGFHRHVLDYFWTSVNGGHGRQHLMDGSTVEHTYSPGETRHESYGLGEFKVHDLENLGDREMIFNTIEFLDSANAPLPVPESVRRRAAG
jgi:beta-alanine degradation protein BauB